MVIVYNSQSYYVVEYPSQHGFEVVDKHARRGTFLTGDLAERFRRAARGYVDDRLRAVFGTVRRGDAVPLAAAALEPRVLDDA